MNRSQLINILSKKTGLDKKDVKRTIDEMQKLIVQEVKEGQRICLHGFGSFKPRFQMRSPSAGANEQIKGQKKRLTFRSKSLFYLLSYCRGEKIRTSDHTPPRRVL